MIEWKKAAGSKDFWSGLMFLGLGAAFFALSRSYSMGTLVRMGPGYFPAILSGLLCLIGLVILARAVFKPGEAVGRIAVGKLCLVVGAILAFALLLQPLGLVVSIFLLVMVASLASIRFSWKSALILSLGLAIGSSIIFVLFLGVPLPLFGTWLGGR